MNKQRIIVIGNGMVGYKFCEKLIDQDPDRQFAITVFGEEPRPAYDRVNLSKYFAGSTVDDLTMATREWYADHDIELFTGERVEIIDVDNKEIESVTGRRMGYDKLVIATGSSAFVPPIPGVDKKGVFVYRTIEDLDQIIEHGRKVKTAAVVGGGLLGLEAAKALLDLNLKTNVIEYNPRLMPRQVDQAGSDVLQQKIEELGISVLLQKRTDAVLGNGSVEGVAFADGSQLDVEMIVVSAGIRPRDEIARKNNIAVGERGGILVDSHLQTSAPDVYAIGECVVFNNMVYGLIAPGYQMADVVVDNLLGGDKEFQGADMSTKLKLLGVDVGSFGDPFAEGDHIDAVSIRNTVKQTYKKIVVDRETNCLIGGILVGDTSDYGTLLQYTQNQMSLPECLEHLVTPPASGAASSATELPDTASICTCENVTKRQIIDAFEDGQTTVDQIKSCTKAGTGCGGCVPLVTDILNAQIKKSGGEVKTALCACFDHSRVELAERMRTEKVKTYWEALGRFGHGGGCEICKPAVASILASYQNDFILNHQNIQDTNDQFLANIQKNGSYSVVPRVPGGEIRPEQLIAIGQVAKDFDLYTKITGGQRIDLFGARVEQLPLIWQRLRDVGLESGHAYAKSLRTVKSCVGSTWCRFGVQDSVGLAIRIENRYKGLRSPHKLKSAVSGCSRECAEAQSKDFGVIATEKGYNLYVCGNGGMKPRHADLFAEDLDEETLIKYIDRFLMYYIRTADRLTRTSKWLEKFEGGIERLRAIVIDDALGICEELEREMQHQVDTYVCEWSRVLDDPAMRRRFAPFVNSDESDPNIHFQPERGQKKPLVTASSTEVHV